MVYFTLTPKNTFPDGQGVENDAEVIPGSLTWWQSRRSFQKNSKKLYWKILIHSFSFPIMILSHTYLLPGPRDKALISVSISGWKQ